MSGPKVDIAEVRNQDCYDLQDLVDKKKRSKKESGWWGW